ncbi:MAG TPA: MATE family efflux transporter [Gemmatimonadales bacterium]|nr:MATE family efflux transporter [Gemmatimonadales bacterium]
MPAATLLPTREELRALLTLAVPVVTVQVGMMLMGVVDTLMVGHVSPAALAAVALGNLYFFAVAIFGMGVLMGLDPIIAQAVGARDEPAIARGVQRGMLLAALLAIPAMILLWPAGNVFQWLEQPADVVPLAATYARFVIPGVLPFLFYAVLRQTLQAMGRLRAIVITIVAANLLNILLNYALVYGHFGMPPLGVAGSSIATTCSRWIMALLLLGLSWPVLRRHLLPIRPEVFSLAPLARMLRLGAPIGAQFELEYGAFGLTGILMGRLGTNQMAGHQVALNLASLTYMVPLGVSAAVAVLVGQAVGRGDPPGARRSARTALMVGATFMMLTSTLFLTIPRSLAGLYTDSEAVLLMAAVLLPLAGIFQVFDGIQVVASGVLRGLGDTRSPMIINVIGFWLVGIPTSLYLAFRTGLGARGLWLGLVLGLASVAVILLGRVRHRLNARIGRVVIDDHGHQS